ncbi:MAG: hypothetical protein K8R90_04365 [Candidatus Cloacimonetes bacterium]|nr:hypothetical protein [Candidatus Cloacimonadota bacterium]
MTIEQAHEYIRKHIEADDYTLYASSRDILQTRFAQNAITQHMHGAHQNIRLSVAFGNRTGVATANNLEEDTISWLLETAQNIARLNQPDPEYVPSEGHHELPETDNYDEATAAWPIQSMVDGVEACVRNAEKREAKVAGISSRYIIGSQVFTANGFVGAERYTEFSHSMTMKKEGAETKVSLGVKRIGAFDMTALIDQMNGQFDSLTGLLPIEAGKYTVIMRPQAVASLFNMLSYYMQRRSADEGVSPFTDQIGKPMFGDRFNLLSTCDDPEMYTPSFDYNLRPAHTVSWVKDGVVENLPADRYWAKKQGVEPVTSFNSYIPGGDVTEAEMMKQAGSGLILNDLWYIRMVDQKRGEFTGMTRDGVMRFENGKIVGAVHNLRWNEITHEAMQRLLALGPAVLLSPNSKVPTMLIKDFNFVDTTTF